MASRRICLTSGVSFHALSDSILRYDSVGSDVVLCIFLPSALASFESQIKVIQPKSALVRLLIAFGLRPIKSLKYNVPYSLDDLIRLTSMFDCDALDFLGFLVLCFLPLGVWIITSG